MYKQLLIYILMFLFAQILYANNYKTRYAENIKRNDATITTIAGVINYVCPKLTSQKSQCDANDPVQSALNIEAQILGGGSLDDFDEMEEEEQDALLTQNGLVHVGAAKQFLDAVLQFKQHYPYRAKAKTFAKKQKWKDAFLHEEQAFQYLVKTASRGIFAKKMLDGE